VLAALCAGFHGRFPLISTDRDRAAASVVGLWSSSSMDLPTGAAIVVAFGSGLTP
jgi:hypothetical protein